MLTPKQRRVLDYITSCVRRDGRSPTYREIQAACGLSSTGHVGPFVNQLVERGFLRRQPGQERGLQPIVRGVAVPAAHCPDCDGDVIPNGQHACPQCGRPMQQAA